MPQFPTQQPSYGLRSELLSIFPAPLIMQRAPTTSDRALPGTIWIDARATSQDAYILISMYSGSAVWLNMAGGGGGFASLTVGPGATNISSSTVSIAGNNDQANVVSITTNAGTSATMRMLNSSGTSANGAILIESTVGGMTIESGAALTLESTENGINIIANGADPGEDIDIQTSASVTVTSTEADPRAFEVNTSAGGFYISGATESHIGVTDAGEDFILGSTLGKVNISAGEADPEAIKIEVLDTAGGIAINSGTGGTNSISTGRMRLESTLAANDAVDFHATAGGIYMSYTAAGSGLTLSNGTQTAQILVGTGSPNGTVTAVQGSIFLNVAGGADTILYVNTDGAMAWTPLTST